MEEPSWKKQLVSDLLNPATTEEKPTICQAPAALRSISPDHFQPKVLRIGLHGRRPYSDGSEELKVALARALLPPQHSGAPALAESDWNKVVNKVVISPKEARQQYERRSGGAEEGCLDINQLDDDAVASMLALDAICVVAFLQVSRGDCSIPAWDDVFREPRWLGLSNQMETELAMMQNQVPMSCLKGAVWVVLEMEVGATELKVVEELENLLRHVVYLLYPLAHEEQLLGFMKATFCGSNALVHCKHILDCLYLVLSENLIFPPDEGCIINVAQDESDAALALHHGDPGKRMKKKKRKKKKQADERESDTCLSTAENRALIDSKGPAKSACRLQVSGIEIQSVPCKLSEISFKDRSFWSAELLLPQLKLYDTTAVELRNLAVYEFVEYPWHGHVRQYMRFINDLVSDVADAKLLVDSGAIVNYVGGFEEIVSIWSGLNQGIMLPFGDENTSVVGAENGINKHCRNSGRLYMADIRSKLFGRPTLFFSALFALILLLLTTAQTYLAIVNSNKWHL